MSSPGSQRPVPPDVLGGEDCFLRALSLQDCALEQAMSRDPDVVRWTYCPVDMTEEQARLRIERFLDRAARGEVRVYVILAGEGGPVGTCAIGGLDDDCPRISYAVLPRSRGRGVATKAARLLAGWALASGYAVVSLETLDGNGASERVASKAGFVPQERYQADHRGETAWLTRWTLTATD